MNEAFFAELSAWLTQAGLAGTAETDIVNGFCDRCVAGRTAARPRPCVHRHAASGARGTAVPLGPRAPMNRRCIEYGRTGPAALAASGCRSQRHRRGRALAAQSVLPDAANRRLAAAPHGSPLKAKRNSPALAGDACRRDDRLCRHHQPLRRRRRRSARWTASIRHGRRAAPDGFSDSHIAALQRARAVSGSRHQIGVARAHDRHADADLSRRATPASACSSGRIVRGVADRIDAVHLVQRPARLHAHHRHRARAGRSRC